MHDDTAIGESGRLPFEGTASGRGHTRFFETPARTELLEQLAQAAQFAGGIQVVEGEQGAGKTTLAHELCRAHLGQCAQMGAVTVPPGADLSRVLAAAAEALGMPPAPAQPAGELLAALRHHAHGLEAQQQVAVLVVDDAHYLDQQATAGLASLLQGAGESAFGLHLVLWSEPGIVARLDALQLVEIPVHDFAVPPFEAEEAAAFLAFYFSPEHDISPRLSDQQLREWHKRSQGSPGQLISLAGTALAEAAPREGSETMDHDDARAEAGEPAVSAKAAARFAGLPVAHVAVLSVLVLVLVWALLAREPEDAETEVAIVPIPVAGGPSKMPAEDAEPAPGAGESPATGVPGDGADAATASISDEVRDLAPVVDERELRNALYGRSVPTEQKDPLALEERQVAGAEAEASQKPTAPPKQAAQQPEQAAKAAANTQRMTATDGNAAQPATTGPQVEPAGDLATLRSFSPESYSLQVMAARSGQSLEQFRERQPNREQLYLYRTRRQGRDWYVLLAGNYATREAAVQAKAALPDAQRAGGPWPRRLEDVHAELGADGES